MVWRVVTCYSISVCSESVRLRGSSANPTYPVLLDRRRIRTQNHLLSSRREFRQPSNGEVLMVDRGVAAENIIGLSTQQHQHQQQSNKAQTKE